MAEIKSTTVTSDRRQRFRTFMKRFNPSASPKAVVKEGWIHLDPERSVFKKLAARADLAPGSQQLVVGGIGSGKTTELLLAEREIDRAGPAVAVYIDVSQETDLSALNSGALLASVGIHLSEMAKTELSPSDPSLARAFEAIRKAAYGHEEIVFVVDEPDDDPELVDYETAPDDRSGYYTTMMRPGKLIPPTRPFPPLHRDIKDLAKSLAVVTSAFKATSFRWPEAPVRTRT